MSGEGNYRTAQEAFWAGAFGTEYSARNRGEAALAANLAFFGRALQRAGKIKSCLELGANIGVNLDALRLLFPGQEQWAVEINADAARELRSKLLPGHVFETSMLAFEPPPSLSCDLELVKGVLIHINPDLLDVAYSRLYEATRRYLLIGEYYNPVPVSVDYRGHQGRLFKRDFAGEIMDRYPSMQLVDYGFVYHRDPAFPQDDITWFLLERR